MCFFYQFHFYIHLKIVPVVVIRFDFPPNNEIYIFWHHLHLNLLSVYVDHCSFFDHFVLISCALQ